LKEAPRHLESLLDLLHRLLEAILKFY